MPTSSVRQFATSTRRGRIGPGSGCGLSRLSPCGRSARASRWSGKRSSPRTTSGAMPRSAVLNCLLRPATRRAVLRTMGRALTEEAPWPAPEPMLPQRLRHPPYSTKDEQRLRSLRLPTRYQQRRLDAVLALGLGAGLWALLHKCHPSAPPRPRPAAPEPGQRASSTPYGFPHRTPSDLGHPRHAKTPGRMTRPGVSSIFSG